ncbi:GntR family transcriptional regulator [Lentzea sp. NBRC 102530]|uniref:GntR family transcriptional regulator n=1 Tax=Lentzea sp. NBRC 102530 TaxID=3032201 RepID=UPI0024A10574|nr:GntR family transcriptional regulator [Lentzea sp. NBRC 102530]GLY55193.1 GntR family transcriptional regulator [Lentzea sp. NBRC 102530]
MSELDQYLQVANDLEQRIEQREWEVGDKLPGQRALAVHYRVSDRVVREAQSVLALRGVILLQHKSAAVVTERTRPRVPLDLGMFVRRNELGYLFNQHAGHWRPVGDPVLDVQPCPDEIADLLQLEQGADVVVRRRVVGPGEPMQVTTTYIPMTLASGTALAEADTGPGGYVERLEQDMGYGPVRWPVQHIARLPSVDEAADLLMPKQLPVLVETRVVLGHDDERLAVDVAVRDSRRFMLRYELHRDESATWPTTPATGRNVPEQAKSA